MTRSKSIFENEVPLSDDDAEDLRRSIDIPVEGKDQFVHRVEDAVTLEINDSISNYPPLTIPSFFANACKKFKNRIAFTMYRVGVTTYTFETYYRHALDVAKGLIALGVKPLDRIGFMCQASVRIFEAIMGSILVGGVYVDLLAPDNKTWMINTMKEAKIVAVFVDSSFAKDIQLDVWDELVHMKSIITTQSINIQDSRVMNMHQLVRSGKKVNLERLAHRLGKHAPNKCCAIFYRSNETLNQPSTPGVMMSHDSMTIMARLISEKILRGELGNFPDIQEKSVKLLTTLPMTKPAAFVMEMLLPLAIGGCVFMTHPSMIEISLWKWMMTIEPSIICLTTRMWVHLRNKIQEKTRSLTSLRDWIFKYAKRKMLDSYQQGRNVPKFSQVVIKGVLKKLGLSKVGLFLCFGATLPQNYFDFFLSLNIQIIPYREERHLSGPYSLSRSLDDKQAESMGSIFPEFETNMMRVGKTGAYKMFVKGRHVCMGILHESMAERVDNKGYLDTEALIVTLQDELFLVGSTADEVVLKTGTVLSSRTVETCFKRLVPIVASCMLVGDNMETAALLITLKTIVNPETLETTDVLTQEVQNWCEQKLQTVHWSAEFLAASKKLHVVINGALVIINRLIKRCGGWIGAYKVLPRNFSILDMEIDPITKELNRSLIRDRYRDDIMTLYP